MLAGRARFFEQLAVWGYGLSEVEQIVVDGGKADDTTAQEATAFDPFNFEGDDHDDESAAFES